MLHSYVRPGAKRPYPLVADNLDIGFSNIKINYTNGKLICQFTRVNAMPEILYYINSSHLFHLMFANGKVNSSSNSKYPLKNWYNHFIIKQTLKKDVILNHGANNRIASSNKINLLNYETEVKTESIISKIKNISLMKAHGALMTFAWIFFGSSGILIASNFIQSCIILNFFFIYFCLSVLRIF